MAKKNKQSDEQIDNVVPIENKESGLVEIEIIEAVAGMEIGTIKKVPSLLAKQIIELGHAKIKN